MSSSDSQIENIDPNRAADGRSLKMKYRDLMEEVNEDQAILTEMGNTKLSDYMRRTNDLFTENVGELGVLTQDAKICHKLSLSFRQLTDNLSFNSFKFTTEGYATALAGIMSSHKVDDPFKLTTKNWRQFGKFATNRFHKSVRYNQGLYGPLGSVKTPDAATPPPKPKERAQRKGTKTKDLIATKEVTEDEDTLQTNALTELHVENLQTTISRLYIENDKKPLPMFSVLLDPESFENTVYNLHHFSFLVKKGSVKMSVLEDGKPGIAPSTKRGAGSSEDGGGHVADGQLVISLTKWDWRRLKENHNIRVCPIPKISEKKSQSKRHRLD